MVNHSYDRSASGIKTAGSNQTLAEHTKEFFEGVTVALKNEWQVDSNLSQVYEKLGGREYTVRLGEVDSAIGKSYEWSVYFELDLRGFFFKVERTGTKGMVGSGSITFGQTPKDAATVIARSVASAAYSY
jgi:hypothetical protein